MFILLIQLRKISLNFFAVLLNSYISKYFNAGYIVFEIRDLFEPKILRAYAFLSTR